MICFGLEYGGARDWRKDDAAALRRAWKSKCSEFVTIYGRRRVGKAFLVNEVFGYKFAVHHAGLKGAGMADQLKNFRMSLQKAGHRKCPEWNFHKSGLT